MGLIIMLIHTPSGTRKKYLQALNLQLFQVVVQALQAWSTNATNGNTGWSAINSEDITVSTNSDISHQGEYFTVTDGNSCQM